MTYLHVKLLNDSVDKSTADIVVHQNEYGVYYSVYSENPKMKSHLEKLLTSVAYIGAPGKNESTFFADSAMELHPNSIYYANALPEILSWRGYDVEVKTETHKSIEFEDFDINVIKSQAPQGIIYNPQGERVVKYVPAGYIAVHNDGRTVVGGGYLNANIDKEGSTWTLVENPYEKHTPQQRQEMRQYMDVGLQEYHPGADEELYTPRESDEPYFHKPRQEYKPSGQALSEYYSPTTQASAEKVVADGYPSYLEPGNVVYSPQTGQAFDTKFWPPEGIDYNNYDWYVFNASKLSDKEKEVYAPLTGLTPELITGISSGVVQSEKNLDVSSGFKLGPMQEENSLTDVSNGGYSEGVRVRTPTSEKYQIRDMLDSGWKKLYKAAKEKLSGIESLTRGKIDESLDEMKLPNLRGSGATFSAQLYGYQKAVVSAMTATEQYEVFGGPKGWHGHFLNVKMGLGKTAMVAAANAIFRNKGLIKNGQQTTIVTAPNKNVYVWQSEIGKFLGEHAVVIDGDRQTRVSQWEDIIKKANGNELPPFVVVGSSKFRYVRGDKDDDEQDAWELDIDAKYMKLLALGGASGSTKVKGNHVGVFTVDESGQYVNPDSARHVALQSIVDAMYHGKAITWTLNGTISGNSATDTLSELSFINKYVRDNYIALVQEYTKPNTDSQRENKSMGRRVWKSHERLRDFFYTFGTQIYSLDGRTVAGKNYGLMRTEDELTPLGEEWGKVYLDAERKLVAAGEEKVGTRAMGLLSILINSGLGAVSPTRLIEYDLGTEKLMVPLRQRLTPEELKVFNSAYKEFISRATETIGSAGRVPKKGMSISARDELYNTLIPENVRSIISDVVYSWECPYTDSIVSSIRSDLQQSTPANRKMKVGVAGFSKISINKIAKKLREIYGPNNYLIQVVDGDVAAEEVDRIQSRHQQEKDRHVISLVTGAGVYGLSLPADRTYRAPAWNSAKGGQYDGRFHRKAEQKNTVTVVVPDGITQYMRELENRKGSMASSATNVLLEVDDESDEITINSNSMSRLLDKLRQYRPRIIERGGQ